MFSVSRFFMSSLKRANLKSKLVQLRTCSFGAKSRDGSDVDKSKRSVSGGSTASDSERREPKEQTIKVAKTAQAAETQQKVQETKSEVTPTTPSVKVISSIPGNRVSIIFY
jgi:hypothetical protein